MERLTNSKLTLTAALGCDHWSQDYGVGDGEGEVFDSFLVVSFLVVVLVVSLDFFVVEDFLVVVDVLAGDFSGIVVVVVSVLLVQAPIRPAANRTVNE